MKIYEMCESERPREKMLSSGASSLSNGELLAIILRTGTTKEGVLDLAQRVLSAAEGRLGKVSLMSVEKLCKIKGIGRGKAVTILAALELGKRCFAELPMYKKMPLISPRMVYDNLIADMKGLMQEECKVLFLNNSHYLLSCQTVSLGGQNSTIIDNRVILRRALDIGASGIILSHNHPSGNPRPSKQDIENTRRLKDALKAFDISLMDHVIVCDDCFYSFADEEITYV